MLGVDPSVSVRRLNVDPYYKPVQQKKRTFSKEKGEAIREIGRNMKIYVDDIFIKSREASGHEANLKESFKNLRRYN
ncbi:hypothetical protein LIER_24995 [Lithospermum erythrorhizon]|uniref:Uncharacterized protein n=1 Tax=Lithospermum erythrorhizon TaxID=34254 RepID=A0AAV3R4M9_LITER